MVSITFIQPDGSSRVVETQPGRTLMEEAVAAGIEGIIAECGGSAACATCHVVLPDALFAELPEPDEHENDMLDFADAERRPTSRLSCQVQVDPTFDGTVVRIPD